MAGWYNYDTGEYEQVDTPETDEQAETFLPGPKQFPGMPDDGPVRGIYRCYRAQGDSIIDAMLKALLACVSK